MKRSVIALRLRSTKLEEQMTAMTEPMDLTTTTAICLYMALELGSSSWVLAFASSAGGGKPRIRRIVAGDLVALREEIRRARKKLSLPADCAVRSCYEAGRDGFWVHRALEELGVTNVVIDPASMARAPGRRAKTDRIDVKRLLGFLMEHYRSERDDIWAVCRVPSCEQEDERRNERELRRLKKERSSQVNAIKSGLALHGVRWGTKKFPERFDDLRGATGARLPRRHLAELNRTLARVRFLESQMAEVREERERWLEDGGSLRTLKIALALQQLKGIGPNLAWTLALDLFWRQFGRSREVGAALGLAPTPHRSDRCVDKELGVSKTGSPHLRAMMVELAWLWLRYQPSSRLSLWFNERFGASGKRSRRIGIVALARKLAGVLWRYAEYGECPDGADFTPRGPEVTRWQQLNVDGSLAMVV